VLEAAARRYGADLTTVWHAYELRPEPVPLPHPDSDYIREHWQRRVYPMAAERGLTMRLPRRPSRSRRALETAMFAREHGRFEPVDRALFRARFEDDRDISDPGVLVAMAEAAGLDGAALVQALETRRHEADVLKDVTLAETLGVRAVPAMIVVPEKAPIESGEPVIGAVPLDWLSEAIDRALRGERPPGRMRPDLR
jgi:predicted DsbA family dithiol-disulfide isomerase